MAVGLVACAAVALAIGAYRATRPAAEAVPAVSAHADARPVTPEVTPAPEPPGAEAIANLLRDAQLAEDAGQLGDAAAFFEKALSMVPGNEAAAAGRDRVRAAQAAIAQRRNVEQAERQVRANSLVRRATGQYEAGEYDAAVESLQTALRLVPRLPAADDLMAKVLRAKAAEEKMKKRPSGRQ